jgi:nucleoside 2-deoxyribosyltransferase
MTAFRCYLAGPLFSDQDRRTLEQIARHLEERNVRVFLPHRDVGDLGSVSVDESRGIIRDKIFLGDLVAIREADFLVALLDGQDSDSGTCVELGIAFSRGIPIFGLKTDLQRRSNVINNMVWGVCGSGERVFQDSELLYAALDKFLSQTALGMGKT